MSDSELAYSTSTGKQKKTKSSQKNTPKASGPMKMRLEKKGRGGKQVTIIFNISMQPVESKAFMKEVQSQLGCGASFKNGEIIFSGDMRDQIDKYCVEKGIKILRAGG